MTTILKVLFVAAYLTVLFITWEFMLVNQTVIYTDANGMDVKPLK